jgi:hypothetical protein
MLPRKGQEFESVRSKCCVSACVSNADQMKAWTWGGFHISSAVNNTVYSPRLAPVRMKRFYLALYDLPFVMCR